MNSIKELGSEKMEIEKSRMLEVLEKQKKAHIEEGPWTEQKRLDLIDRSINMLLSHQADIIDVVQADFGHRSTESIQIVELGGSINALKYSREHLHEWMKPSMRETSSPQDQLGSTSRVEYLPKGCVGLISPWNLPVNLTMAPLSSILAAGNRVMIKPSEFTPETSELLKQLFSSNFNEAEAVVITGGAETGAAFSAQPFDHLIFTGSTAVGRHVMRSAAENLVPVTLELGGKSPVLVSRSVEDLQFAADRIMTGKTMNGGQLCLAPDYALVPVEKLAKFVECVQAAVSRMYPTLIDNQEYTSIINQRHVGRLVAYIDDAKEKGAKIIEINPAKEDFSGETNRKIPPTLILNPTADMTLMQEEIFGPVLPILTYDNISETIEYINSRPRPLAFYYFGFDETEESKVLAHITSGGVTVNDVLMHHAQEDLPFGGVGASGMGAYDAYEGFLEFSHARAIYSQTAETVIDIFRPPYGELLRNLIAERLNG